MERLKALKTVIWMIIAILALQLGIIVYMIRPSGFFVWAGLVIIAILVVYMARIALMLLRELKEHEGKSNR